MTVNLVRLPVDLRALAAFAVANGADDDDGGYALHLALRRRFGVAGPQPFRLLEGQAGATVLGYADDGDSLLEAGALPVMDACLDAVFPEPPQLRVMPAEWRPGQRLGFEVRVRPVVRFGARIKAERREGATDATIDWSRRAGEVDAYVAAGDRARTGDSGGEDPGREAVYAGWLARRLAPAARAETVSLRQFRRVRTRRSPHGRPGRNRVEGPEALLAGTLVNEDPIAFATLLAHGVGRHTAFGFGMLLLSPPGRSPQGLI